VHLFSSESDDEKKACIKPQLTSCCLLEVVPATKIISFPLHIVLKTAVPLSSPLHV
jgi:hypothetical protein